MASSTSTTFALSSPSTLADGKAPPTRQQSAAPHCITLPTLPPPHSSSQSSEKILFRWNSKAVASFGRRIARNVVTMATAGESIATTRELPAAEGTTTELPAEILKTLQNAWDGLDDKYAVTSLAVAGIVALWATTGTISAIDRLPLVPGVLELVGIGYTGWFAYRNLVFKPDRDALVARIKSTYSEIIGSN